MLPPVRIDPGAAAAPEGARGAERARAEVPDAEFEETSPRQRGERERERMRR